MKFLFFSFAVLATTCCIQAYNYEVTFSCKYDEDKSTMGNLNITLLGATTSETFNVNEKFDGLKDIKFKVKLYEYAQKIFVQWKSDSKKPLYLDTSFVNIDNGRKKTKFIIDKYVFSEKNVTIYF